MIWLAAQMWILLALSMILGLLTGWWVWHRSSGNGDEEADMELANLRARIQECNAEKTKLRAQLLEFETERAALSEPELSDSEPYFYETASDGDKNDLQQIKGIGPHLEKMLNEMGVYYYHQIAAWTDGQAAKVDDRLRFKGRILRDNWRTQASVLASRPQAQGSLGLRSAD